MAQGKRILPPYVFQSTSLGASFTSEAVTLSTFDRAFLQIVCTGTPTGTLTIQGSADGVTWTDLPLALTALSGSAQNYFLEMATTALPKLRIKYVRSSGTGTMTATITAKES